MWSIRCSPNQSLEQDISFAQRLASAIATNKVMLVSAAVDSCQYAVVSTEMDAASGRVCLRLSSVSVGQPSQSRTLFIFVPIHRTAWSIHTDSNLAYVSWVIFILQYFLVHYWIKIFSMLRPSLPVCKYGHSFHCTEYSYWLKWVIKLVSSTTELKHFQCYLCVNMDTVCNVHLKIHTGIFFQKKQPFSAVQESRVVLGM